MDRKVLEDRAVTMNVLRDSKTCGESIIAKSKEDFEDSPQLKIESDSENKLNINIQPMQSNTAYIRREGSSQNVDRQGNIKLIEDDYSESLRDDIEDDNNDQS